MYNFSNMPRHIADRTEYYAEYYLKQRDLRKYDYYEKKMRKKEMEQLYNPHGGEKSWYKKKYKEFCEKK